MKLTYWIADRLDDSRTYSMRARTRKQCETMREAWGEDYQKSYGKPRKVVIEYENAFDLVLQCMDGEVNVEGYPTSGDVEDEEAKS